jgi:3-hydroxy-9,10-secoandrosta-1,3,5(10)-triene-9,17-dione monooxygenase
MEHQEVLEAVRALAPTLRERSPEGESLRRLPEATVKDMKATGMSKLLQPRRYGG